MEDKNTELATRLCEEMGIQYSSGSGRIFIAGEDVTDVPFSEIYSDSYKEDAQ